MLQRLDFLKTKVGNYVKLYFTEGNGSYSYDGWLEEVNEHYVKLKHVDGTEIYIVLGNVLITCVEVWRRHD